ncbi:MAG: SPOR domain-containing protein [Balneolaceae bacterium]|nr:SPOR domain-containing protein [Balneolaceae bacterium]
MKIDREQLAALLAERSGLDKEEVQAQLDTLMERIRSAAKEGRSFEIEQFGTFRMEGGELSFEPSRTLRTEINQKYAGMKPIELIGAYKEQHVAGETPQGEEDVIAAGASDEKGEASRSFELDTGQADPADAGSGKEDSRRSRIKARAAKARREAAHRSGEEGQAQEKKGESAAVPPSSGEKTPSSRRDNRHVKTSRDKRSGGSLGRIAAAVVLVVAVAAAGWVAWDSGLFDPAGPEAGESVQTPAEPDNRPSLSQDEQAAGEQEAVQTEQSGGEDVTTAGGEASSSGYGLEGDMNTNLSSYYAIVVHSLADRTAAENRADQLRQQGYRVTVRTTTVGGTQYWRVGLGQFESITKAREAADGLSEPFRSDHFIRNIQ